MKSKHVRTGVRLLFLGGAAYLIMGAAYVVIVIAANW